MRRRSSRGSASGRALGLGRDEGMTKLLFEPESQRLLGAGIVGVNAGDLIAETVLALEMGANAEDIALTVHPHPTLSETVGLARRARGRDDHRPHLAGGGQGPSSSSSLSSAATAAGSLVTSS